MRIAGIEVGSDAVAELVTLLRDEYYTRAADTLEYALQSGRPEVALMIRERTQILDVLDDPPAGLEQLRGVLLEDHVWRTSAGLTPERMH